jgi:hypothetical protein
MKTIKNYNNFLNEEFFFNSKKEREEEKINDEKRRNEYEEEKINNEKSSPIKDIIKQINNNELIDIKKKKEENYHDQSYKIKLPYGVIILTRCEWDSGDIDAYIIYIKEDNIKKDYIITDKTGDMIWEKIIKIAKSKDIEDEFDF